MGGGSLDAHIRRGQAAMKILIAEVHSEDNRSLRQAATTEMIALEMIYDSFDIDLFGASSAGWRRQPGSCSCGKHNTEKEWRTALKVFRKAGEDPCKWTPASWVIEDSS